MSLGCRSLQIHLFGGAGGRGEEKEKNPKCFFAMLRSLTPVRFFLRI